MLLKVTQFNKPQSRIEPPLDYAPRGKINFVKYFYIYYILYIYMCVCVCVCVYAYVYIRTKVHNGENYAHAHV